MKQMYLLCGLLITFFFMFSGCSSDDDVAGLPDTPPVPHLNVQDSLLTVEIWRQAGGEHWPFKWDLKDFSTWAGVGIALDTDKNEYRILQLYLNTFNDHSIVGTLSAKIGELEELRFFAIGGLGITGDIPKSLGNLKHLRELMINTTSMSGTIPDEIFSLPSLERLEICNNRFIRGELPEAIANLSPAVISCMFTSNNLSGKVPSGIRIKSLDLDDNKYTEYPFGYSKKGVTAVRMSRNYIAGIIPDSILNDAEALERLRSMTFNQRDGCKFTNAPDLWGAPIVY